MKSLFLNLGHPDRNNVDGDVLLWPALQIDQVHLSHDGDHRHHHLHDRVRQRSQMLRSDQKG